MLKASYQKHILDFNMPGGTSRGVLYNKPSWYLKLEDENGKTGIGEISIIPGLSLDNENQMDNLLQEVCQTINDVIIDYRIRYQHSPALCFGIETALKSLDSDQSPFILYNSKFCNGTDSIKINGLIWMGSSESMNQQIESKLELGFTCLKLKIGAIKFDEEIQILKDIRKRFSKDTLELRVDANGAFTPEEAMDKLKQLAKLDLHSIEQPIKAGQWSKMADLCAHSDLPIALDEELIGITDREIKKQVLDKIKPQYIILKPSLISGFKMAEEWIKLAEDKSMGWWVTSALEGNIGLNAIAQWTYTLQPNIPQGLGTGQVFKNNISSPLRLKSDQLFYIPDIPWEQPFNKA